MKLLTAIWLFLVSISAYAEEAEKPMETVGKNGILAFLGFCVILVVVFIYYFRKNSKAREVKQADGENKPS